MAATNPTRRNHSTRRLLALSAALIVSGVMALNLRTWIDLPGTSGAAAALPSQASLPTPTPSLDSSVLPSTGPSDEPTPAPTAAPTAAPDRRRQPWRQPFGQRLHRKPSSPYRCR